MSTNSTIALEFADGTISQIYCHWDGYMSFNGKILFESYSDPWKLRDLIKLGALSILHDNIGEKHDFEQQYEGCTFYGRDRGDEDTGPESFENFEDYRSNSQSEEYDYILRNDGKWYVRCDSNGFVPMTKEMIDKAE